MESPQHLKPPPSNASAAAADGPSPRKLDSKGWRVYSGLTDDAAPSSLQPPLSSNQAPSPPQPSLEAKRESRTGPSTSGCPSSQRRAQNESAATYYDIDELKLRLVDWRIEPTDLALGERLGAGSFGEVVRGIWNGTDVAVKVIMETGSVALDEFKTEVEVMAKLRHPNIVLFLGWSLLPREQLAIISEFIPRGSLFDLLHRSTVVIDPRRRVALAKDIVKGLLYLHSCQPPIVHRDLKSPNLLVDKDFSVKVCDFGLSRIMTGKCLSTKKTVGTLHWVSQFSTIASLYILVNNHKRLKLYLFRLTDGSRGIERRRRY